MIKFKSDVLLSCAASGDKLVYQWTYNNTILVHNSHYHNVDGEKLTIKNIQSSHSGLYQCVVSNRGGRVATRRATVLAVAVGECICCSCYRVLV